MKNWQYCIFILSVFYYGCERKQSPLPSTSLETPFLRKVEVKGAKEVVIDHTNKTILIVLPESYTSDEVILNMDLVDGVVVSSTDPVITLGFKGGKPIDLIINNKYSTSYHIYKIYIDLEGKINARLSDEGVYVSSDGTGIADLIFTSGIGTIPERPNETKSIEVKLYDSKSGYPAITNSGTTSYFSFQEAYKILPSDNIDLIVEYKDEKFVYPQKLTLNRWKLRAEFDSLSVWWSGLQKNKELKISGGCFLESKKYRVKLDNALQKNPIWVDARYEDLQKLSINIPASIQNGNYFVGVYEGEDLISKNIYTISNTSAERGIQQVWAKFTLRTTYVTLDAGKYEPITAKAGSDIYVNSFPVLYGTFDGTKVTEGQLPLLKLVREGEVHEISPRITEDRAFADGALVLYYGTYTLPKDLVPGKYSIQLIYNDHVTTTPFCKELNIESY